MKVFLAKNEKLVYFIIMIDNNDSLARTAHAFGMTDLEFEQRSQVEAELAAQQVIRRWQEEEKEVLTSVVLDKLDLSDEEENLDLF